VAKVDAEVEFPSGGYPEMNQDTRDAQNRRILMESAGFRLQNEDEPGIYVREEQEKDMIDWQSEPADLFLDVRTHIEPNRTKSRGGE
jgi:hypothetical protein